LIWGVFSAVRCVWSMATSGSTHCFYNSSKQKTYSSHSQQFRLLSSSFSTRSERPHAHT